MTRGSQITLRELTDEEYHRTFAEPMHELGDDEDPPAINIRNYVGRVIRHKRLPTTNDDIRIHYFYENGTKTYTHVLFWYGVPNVYLVIVIENEGPRIHGHHILDLNEKYGLRPGK